MRALGEEALFVVKRQPPFLPGAVLSEMSNEEDRQIDSAPGVQRAAQS